MRPIILGFLLIWGVIFFRQNAWADSVNSRVREGVSHYHQKEYKQAEDIFSQTVQHQPENPKLSYNLANSRYKNDNFEGALQAYNQSATAASPELKQNSIYNSGNALFRLNKLEEAEAAYKKALKLNPGDMDAKFNLEFVREKLKEKEQSKQKKDQEGQGSNSGENQDQSPNSPPQPQNDGNKEDPSENPANQNPDSQKKADSDPPSPVQESENTGNPLPGWDQTEDRGITREQADHWLRALNEDLKSIRKKQAGKEQAGANHQDKDW